MERKRKHDETENNLTVNRTPGSNDVYNFDKNYNITSVPTNVEVIYGTDFKLTVARDDIPLITNYINKLTLRGSVSINNTDEPLKVNVKTELCQKTNKEAFYIIEVHYPKSTVFDLDDLESVRVFNHFRCQSLKTGRGKKSQFISLTILSHYQPVIIKSSTLLVSEYSTKSIITKIDEHGKLLKRQKYT